MHLVHALDVASREALACFRLQLLALCAQEWEGESGAPSGKRRLLWPGPTTPRGQGSPKRPGGRPRCRQCRGAGRGSPQSAAGAGWANASRAPPARPIATHRAPGPAACPEHAAPSAPAPRRSPAWPAPAPTGAPGACGGSVRPGRVATPAPWPSGPWAPASPPARLPVLPRRPPAAAAAPEDSR